MALTSTAVVPEDAVANLMTERGFKLSRLNARGTKENRRPPQEAKRRFSSSIDPARFRCSLSHLFAQS